MAESDAKNNDELSVDDNAKSKSAFGKRLILGVLLVIGGVFLLIPRLYDVLGGNADNPVIVAVNKQSEKLPTGEFAPDVELPEIGLSSGSDVVDSADASDLSDDAVVDSSDGAGSDDTESEVGVTGADGETPGEDVFGSDEDPDAAAQALLAENAAKREAGANTTDNGADADDADEVDDGQLGVTGADGETPGEDVLGSDVDPDAAAQALLAENAAKREAEATAQEASSQDAVDAAAEQIDALNEENTELANQLEALEAELAATKAASNIDGADLAAAELRVRLSQGEPIADVLTELEDLGIAVPDALREAGDATPSLSQLRDEYPAAAHAALRASIKASKGDKWYDGITTLAKSEFAGRSMEPQEGNGPDAVLSRVEEALRNGDLEAVIGEAAILPSESQDALAPWLDMVQTRLAVTRAVDDITTKKN